MRGSWAIEPPATSSRAGLRRELALTGETGCLTSAAVSGPRPALVEVVAVAVDCEASQSSRACHNQHRVSMGARAGLQPRLAPGPVPGARAQQPSNAQNTGKGEGASEHVQSAPSPVRSNPNLSPSADTPWLLGCPQSSAAPGQECRKSHTGCFSSDGCLTPCCSGACGGGLPPKS